MTMPSIQWVAWQGLGTSWWRSSIRVAILFVFFFTPCSGTWIIADDLQSKAANRDESLLSFEDQETKSMEFVQSHHPELVSLLQLLKSMKRDEYEIAIRDIVRVRKRLEVLEKRDPPMYSIDLDAWKLQSKMDLLLAKAVGRDTELDTNALRNLVEQRIENQKKRLALELERLLERKKQITESMERIEGHEQERVSQQLAALIKKVDAKKKSPPNKNKPAKKDQ